MTSHDTAGLIRIATVRIREGMEAELVRAAHANAQDALGAGALTAEVVGDPGDESVIRVVSRWPSPEVLREFLEWHEQHAHESMADYSQGRPTAVHHPVLEGSAQA